MKGTVSLPGWPYFSIRLCNSARATSWLLLGPRPYRRGGDSRLSAHSSFRGDGIPRSALQYRPGWSSSGWCLTRVPPIFELLSPNDHAGHSDRPVQDPRVKFAAISFPSAVSSASSDTSQLKNHSSSKLLESFIILLLLWLEGVHGGDCKTTCAIPNNASLLDNGIAST